MKPAIVAGLWLGALLAVPLWIALASHGPSPCGPRCDLNDSGAITLSDVQMLLQHVGERLPTATPVSTATPTPLPATVTPSSPNATATPSATPPPTATPGASGMWLGANRYPLAGQPGYLTGCKENTPLSQMFSTMTDAGLTVMRFWAFQSYATRNGQRDWAALDAVFTAAQQANVKLMPVLGNHWASCEDGGASFEKGCTWYGSGYTSRDGAYPQSYQTWATEAATRYSEHPALLMWELVNEPWVSCIHAFVADVSARIRAADPVTPIGIGGGDEGWDCRVTCALPAVTHASSHDYDSAVLGWPSDVNGDWLDANAVGKPFYLGETGVDCYADGGGDPLDDPALCNPCDGQLRADYLEAKIVAARDHGAVGLLLWHADATPENPECGYDFGPGSPTWDMLAGLPP